MKINEPLVSICCITYNHEKYIKETIEGFLKQKTSFPIEIIIHDDASIDNTVSIIDDYGDKFPSIIRTIVQKENQWSKGGGSIFVRFVFPQAKGKYIALCEGDDYWTDPYKLQKQVDFLEKNSDYGLVHTSGVLKYIENDKRVQYVCDKNKGQEKVKGEIFKRILLGEYNILTCSVCFRKKFTNSAIMSHNKFLMGDTFLWLEIAANSKIKCFDCNAVVHNILPESASKSKDMKKILNFSKSGLELERYFAEKYVQEEVIKREIEIRRNNIFVDICFRGRLQYEGVSAFKELKSIQNILQIRIETILKYYALKFNIGYSCVNYINKIIGVLKRCL